MLRRNPPENSRGVSRGRGAWEFLIPLPEQCQSLLTCLTSVFAVKSARHYDMQYTSYRRDAILGGGVAVKHTHGPGLQIISRATEERGKLW